MKKIIAGGLVLLTLLGACVNVFAETNECVLTYSNVASYEIRIPASGEVDSSTGTGTIDIDISDVNVGEENVVSVSIASENANDEYWKLVDIENEESFIPYNIYNKSAKNRTVLSGDKIVYANEDTSVRLGIELTGEKIGVFKDTITFISEVESAYFQVVINGAGDANIYESFTVRKGMTWEDWVLSDLNPLKEDNEDWDGNWLGIEGGQPWRLPGNFDIVIMGNHENHPEHGVKASDLIIEGVEYWICAE